MRRTGLEQEIVILETLERGELNMNKIMVYGRINHKESIVILGAFLHHEIVTRRIEDGSGRYGVHFYKLTKKGQLLVVKLNKIKELFGVKRINEL